MRYDFDALVRLCAQRTNLNISCTNVSSGGGNDIEDRYYSRKEYSSLISNQKENLKQLRKKRKRWNDKKSLKKAPKDMLSVAIKLKKLARLPKQISAIESTLKAVLDDCKAATSAADDSSTDHKEEVSLTEPASDNVRHPALTIQKRKKK